MILNLFKIVNSKINFRIIINNLRLLISKYFIYMNNNSRNLIDTSVYSLDGNDIYEVALAFERLAIQELNRNPEFIYQGNNISSYEKDGYDFKISMDKLISLVKEFYVKVVSRNQGLNDFTSS